MTLKELDEEMLFQLARKLESPALRDDFLRQACGDDEPLRARVLALLDVLENERTFLSSPAAVIATSEKPVTEGPGTTIGPYKLLEQIGEGGFGLVYMAEQQQPVRRKVAVKILKPGMDSRQVIARFEAERQALALMDHTNIAKVLDAGETSSGHPYFVMELCRGVPITDYCDHNALALRERLELFVSVCQAVQHAHHKGIIHRDIKPTNVLVTLYDGVPVVKVIDFGIAKALGQPLTDKTLYTGFAQMIGTPLYMSPEQAEMSGLDVDTRTDVYSLAVLLYELLTGTTPFDKERFCQASYDEVRRIIREEEPSKPSTRLSTMGAAATPVSARRQSNARRLTQLFRGDLDWIVMKALEKDRNRRYETAGHFARDVQRYLRDEAVSACPPSSWYRFRKFARRHRWAMTLSAVVATALVVVAAGSLIAALGLNSALQVSETHRQHAQEAERTARDAEKAARERLYASLVAQARASRLSRRMGQRFETLATLAEAAKIARENPSSTQTLEERIRELRDEAIACLALPDVRMHQEWNGNPGGGYLNVDFDDNLERYARADGQGQVSIRRVADDKEIHSLRIWPGDAWPQLSPDGRFLLVHTLTRMKVWRLGEPGPEVIVPESEYHGAAFSSDSRLFAMGHRDAAVSIHELPSGRLVRRLPLDVPCNFLAFHPQERQLAVVAHDGIQVIDYETGKTAAPLLQCPEMPPMVAWHPHGKVLAAVAADSNIYLWDVVSGKQIGKLQGCTNGGININFNHAGDLLASTGWEGYLRLWDWRTGRQLFSTHTGYQLQPHFSADDHLLAADLRTQKLRIWEVNTGGEYRTLVRDPALDPLAGPEGLAVDPTGRLLAVAMTDGVGFWNLKDGQPAGFVPFRERTNSAVFERSGALLTYGPSGLLRWPSAGPEAGGDDRETASLIRLGPVQKLPIPAAHYRMAASADGGVVACGHGWGAVVWHKRQPGPLVQLVHANARTVAVSPNGEWIVTAGFSYPGGAKVWQATGQSVKDLPVGSFCEVAFSPDGKWLATSAAAGEVRLWSVDSWTQPTSTALPGPDAMSGEYPLAFCPDSTILAVGSKSGIRLIAVQTGREFAHLEDPNQETARALAFSSDGIRLIVGSNSARSLHVWDLAAIRRRLAAMDLDWELPAYAPPTNEEERKPFKLEVDRGTRANQ